MKTMGAVVLVAILGGCTSVKLVQRDGCWVRRTEQPFGRVTEDVGPCVPPKTELAEDRQTRLIEECIARADYHWQTRALIAWNKGLPIPERDSDATVLENCMNDTTRALASENQKLKDQNDTLKSRLADVSTERDALRARADEARDQLLASQVKIADRLLSSQEKLGDKLLGSEGEMARYLGEAAKKSSQPAVATATANSHSDGSATTDSTATSPATPAVVSAGQTAGRHAAKKKTGVRAALSCPPGNAAQGPAKAQATNQVQAPTPALISPEVVPAQPAQGGDVRTAADPNAPSSGE